MTGRFVGRTLLLAVLLLASALHGRAQTGAVRINSGGPAYTDRSGHMWSADRNFTGGNVFGYNVPVAGTTDQALFQTQRWSQFSYQLAVPDGTYSVGLYFAEIYPGSQRVGARVFWVKINGTAVLTNFDVFARAGANVADVERFAATASGGRGLLIELGPVNVAFLDAIEVLPVTAPPPTPGDTRAPAVSLLSPIAGAVTGAPTVSVQAADDSGTVSSVQVLVDGQPLGPALTAPPYIVRLDTALLSVGPHVLSATATDPSGNVGRAADVAVTVAGELFDVTLLYDDGTPYAVGGHVAVAENVGTVASPVWQGDVFAVVSTAGRAQFRWTAAVGAVYSVQVTDAAGALLWETGTELTPALVPVQFLGVTATVQFSRATGAWTGLPVFRINY